MKQRELDKWNKDHWCICPICGFHDCSIITRGKDIGMFRCYECNIKWIRPKIIRGI